MHVVRRAVATAKIAPPVKDVIAAAAVARIMRKERSAVAARHHRVKPRINNLISARKSASFLSLC